MRTLSFSILREANVARLPQFKNKKGGPAHSQPDGSDWDIAQWVQALVGEVGEYANVRKKFDRGDIDLYEFMTSAASELADIQTYLDILAFRLEIDLSKAITKLFHDINRLPLHSEIKTFDDLRAVTLTHLQAYLDWTPAQYLAELTACVGRFWLNYSAEEPKHYPRNIAVIAAAIDGLAYSVDVNMSLATIEKFNSVSERVGSNVFIYQR